MKFRYGCRVEATFLACFAIPVAVAKLWCQKGNAPRSSRWGQATVSRSIDQIAPVVRQCIPIPAKIHDRTKRASTLEELEEILLQ